MKWYKVIFNINRLREASGGKMLYYAIRNIVLYLIGFGIFLGGILTNDSSEIISLVLLIVGGLCMVIVSLYQFLMIGFASAKIKRNEDKGKNISALVIAIISIVVIVVAVLVMVTKIL